MRAHICFAIAILGELAVAAHGQIVSATVDILSPGDPGYEGLPANRIVIDYFVDVASTDVWTAAGTRVLTENGATLVYSDGDLNVAGVQPIVINPGLDGRFSTSVSRPLARNEDARFTDCGAIPGTGYTTPPFHVLFPTDMDAAWPRYPPANSSTPSEDGYVARIAIDLGAAGHRRDFLMLSEDEPPAGSIVYARTFTPFNMPGWGNFTFDVPSAAGVDWFLFDPVPEPATIALLLGGAALLRKRKE